MKKKIFIGIGCAVVAVAIALSVVFLIVTRNEKPANPDFTIVGTWKVYKKDNPNEDQYYVFTEEEVKVYNGSTSNEPYISSKYELTLGLSSELKLTDLGNNIYKIEEITDRYLSLYDTVEKESIEIVKTNDESLTTYDKLNGQWQAVCHGKEVKNEEISFSNNQLICTRDGKEIINSAYTIDEKGILVLPNGAKFDIAYLDSEYAVIVSIEKEANSSDLKFTVIDLKRK